MTCGILKFVHQCRVSKRILKKDILFFYRNQRVIPCEVQANHNNTNCAVAWSGERMRTVHYF